MKTIPSQLLDHQGLPVTTTCLLVKVAGVGAFAGVVLGFTDLDENILYDDLTDDVDSSGAIEFKAPNGIIPKRFRMSSAAMIDNSAIDGVITDDGITEQMVRAGFFQSAKMTVYRVNWQDRTSGTGEPIVLTAGRHEVMAYGRGGRTRFSRDGFSVDFRDLADLLRQPIGPLISVTCRAQYGDPDCGKAFVWETATIDGLGAETDRQFGASGISKPEGYYTLGVVEILDGDNAGQQMEVDLHLGDTGSAEFDLSFGLPYPLVIGVQFRIRQDCLKTFEYCRDVHDNKNRFRGEHLTPLDGTSMVPGAEIIRA